MINLKLMFSFYTQKYIKNKQCLLQVISNSVNLGDHWQILRCAEATDIEYSNSLRPPAGAGDIIQITIITN